MVMVYIKQLDKECYLDGYLKDNLDELKKAVALKWDGCLLFTGYEGDGKTTSCSQVLAYCDQNFGLDNVCFTLAQVKWCVAHLPPGSAIQYDESRKDTNINASNENLREFIRIMTENRYKQFYWGIISSTFFDLKKYFVIHRTRALIDVYANGLERGYFSFYNRDKKKQLYIRGKKDWDLNAASPNFRGRFTNWLPFDEQAYDKKKRESTAAEEEAAPEWPSTPEGRKFVIKQGLALVDYLQRNQWITHGGPLLKNLATYYGVSPRTLVNYRQELRFSSGFAGAKREGSGFATQKQQENKEYDLESDLFRDEGGRSEPEVIE